MASYGYMFVIGTDLVQLLERINTLGRDGYRLVQIVKERIDVDSDDDAVWHAVMEKPSA